MLLKMIISATEVEVTANIPNEGSVLKGEHSILFSVSPEGEGEIILDTGEHFLNPRQAKLFGMEGNSNLVDGKIGIRKALDETYYHHNKLEYSPRYEPEFRPPIPPQLYFSFYLPSQDFDELMNNIQNSLLPSSAMIELNIQDYEQYENSPIKIWGPAGDGSYKLDTASLNKTPIKIANVRFLYKLNHLGADAPRTIIEQETYYEKNVEALLVSLNKSVAYIKYCFYGLLYCVSAFAALYFIFERKH